MAALFAASVMLWPGELTNPLEILKLALWLVALVVLAINFVYDARWSLLVTTLNWLLIGCGAVFAAVTLCQQVDISTAVASLGGAVMILGGLYGALWLVSRGAWIGDGDIFLGTGLALFLGDWRVAFVALFAANFFGMLSVLPAMISGSLQRGSHVPFGPFLIVGALFAWFFGKIIIDYYQLLVLI